jgi:hypothetical protein
MQDADETPQTGGALVLCDEVVGSFMVDPLILAFAQLVASVPADAFGFYEFTTQPIPDAFDGDRSPSAFGYGFLETPNGSIVGLLELGDHRPVVLFDSEGSSRTAADNLDDFLWRWADGSSEVMDIPGEAPSELAALGAWLIEGQIPRPEPAPIGFDFDVWLDGGTGFETVPLTPLPASAPSEVFARLDPQTQALVDLLGRRVEDPVLRDWATQTFGPRQRLSYICSSGAGLQAMFTHFTSNPKYPLLNKSKNSVVQYLTQVDLSAECGRQILGVPWNVDADQLTALVGPTNALRSERWDEPPTLPMWKWELDSARESELSMWFDPASGLKVHLAIRSTDP